MSDSTFRSVHSNTSVSLTIRNKTNQSVDIFWVNYQGDDIKYASLAPRDEYLIGTYATHPWRARYKSSGQEVNHYVATTASQQIFLVEDETNPPLTSVSLTPLNAFREDKLNNSSQIATWSFNIDFTLYHAGDPGFKYLHVDAHNTRVAASKNGRLHFDQDDKRGYFLEKAEVIMEVRHQNALLVSDGPDTDMGGGSVTSSSTWNVGGDFSISKSPSVGGNAGLTIGRSYSETLTDFVVQNNSTGNKAIHNYLLGATSKVDGGGKMKYSSWRDLFPMDAEGQLTGVRLNDVPALSKSNIPIPSQAIWRLDGDFRGQVQFYIKIRQVLRYCEKTFNVFWVDRDTHSYNRYWWFTRTIDFSEIN
ncbi:MAG: hypothetical protein H6668_11000 [Ardenticatenaceae bacterium]|nr:hypothetical protein [Ardenticatenaceae bacterium]